LSQIKQEILSVFQHNSTTQSPNGSSLSAAHSGLQVFTGLSGVFSPPGTSNSHGLSASPSIGGRGISNNHNIAAHVLNEYEKTVEVDQRKLRDPELTPMALRKWKLAYNIYAKDPNKRMTMTEAFGEESMRCLGSATNTYSSSILSAAAHRSAQLPYNHNEGKWPPPSATTTFFYSYSLYVFF